MTTPETIATALATGGVDKGLAAAGRLLEKLFGPAAEEVGLILREKVYVYRLRNRLRVLAQAEELIGRSGREPGEVALRILLPILEAASLEDNDILRQKWAGLLATAAVARDVDGVHPSFPKILSELSPREAQLLDRLTTAGGKTAWYKFRGLAAEYFGLTEEMVNQDYGNLFRLGLCRIGRPAGISEPLIELGPFGEYFVRAVQGPDRVR